MYPEIEKSKLKKWAETLVDYSLGGVTKDDIVMVKGEHSCWPLISEIQDKIIKDGAIADVNLIAPDNERGKVWSSSMALHGTPEQIDKVPDWHIKRYKAMTKYIEILGAEDLTNFENLPIENAQLIMKADAPIKNLRLSKPWVISLFPTQGFANIEGLSLEEYSEVLVNAAMVDHRELGEIENSIRELFDRTENIRIITIHPETDKELELKLNIKDRFTRMSVGKRNYPDGEVFTSPDANSVNGEIYVDLPIFQGGGTIQGIYLKIVNGIIKKYSAKQGFEILEKIVETDEGSHRIGEVALGMNNGITKQLKHPLMAEKLGGTLHIAIGASYADCFSPTQDEDDLSKYKSNGTMNESAQHIDIVTSFRTGGSGKAVYFDDKLLRVSNNLWCV